MEQVRHGDWFLAVRAEPTEPNPAAGPAAVGTPLLAEVAGFAFAARIDGDVPAGSGGRDGQRFGLGDGLPPPPRGPPAAI